MKKAVTCPVCFGVGKVDGGFYTRTSETWYSSGGTEICRSCNGCGYIVIEEEDDARYVYEAPPETTVLWGR